MLEWHVVSADTYYGAEAAALNNDYLYFLSDTHEIYKGATKFDEAVELLTAPNYDLPTTPARKRIYIHPLTMEGKIYDGTQWVTVIRPVVTTITENSTALPTAGAVYTAIDDAISDLAASDDVMASLTWTQNTHKLTYTMADGTTTHDVELTGLGIDLQYNASTGLLQVKDCTGTAIGTGVNLDLERFISSASYDHQTRTITLNFNTMADGQTPTPLEIDVGDLVDTYTAANSNTVALTVTNNQFTAEAIVSTAAGNQLTATQNGLYVAAFDPSDYMLLDEDAVVGNVAKFAANGQVEDAGYTLGGDALAPSSGVYSGTTLATEKAVNAAIQAAIQALDYDNTLATKVDKVTDAVVGDVATFVSGGNIQDSGKTIGGATLAATPNANTLATEAAVQAVADTKVDKTSIVTSVDASSTDTEVLSAGGTYRALSWKTTL